MKRQDSPGSKRENTLLNRNVHTRRSWLVSLAAMAVLTLGMFGDVLFGPGERVLSNQDADLAHFFIHWRHFGFEELRHGNLALWNPHYCCGTPFFGGFQSALLYPPNALFLVLPLAQATNWSISLHVFLAGAFTYAWAARRRLHPLACFLSGVMFMFGGPFFLHIDAGHLPNLCAMVWAALLFLAIDGTLEQPSLGWTLLGMFAVAMQVLAGHPQYLFYTAVGAAVYCGLYFPLNGKQKWVRVLLGLAAIVAGGLGLSAVQLFTGLQESGETLRSKPLTYEFAGMFSFPPENLLTLLAPNFFGDGKESQYWGRSYLWEMSLFVGVTGLVMAVVGADQNHEEGTRRGRQEARGKRIAKGIWLWVVGHRELVMVGILFVLALGAHTPLFKALYHWVPGFDKFRGSSKFIFLASMFLALLAGMGLDRLARGWRPTRAFIAGTGAGALMLLLAGLWARQAGEVVLASAEPPGETIGARSMSGWHKLMLAVRETDEIYLARATYQDASFVSKSARVASKGLLVGAGTLAIVVSLLAYQRMRGGRVVIWLLVLAVAELVVFGRQSLDSFDLRTTQMPEVAGTLAKHPGDYRILNLVNPNVAMTIGGEDVWGDDPGSLLRCAELLAFTQGQNPDTVSQYLTIGRQHPLFDLLRCRFIFAPGDGKISIYENGRAFPRLVLAPAFKVLKSRDEIFGAMTNAAFNPTEEVILEREPAGGSQKSEAKSQERRNEAKVVDSGTDWMAIEAESKQASILLITDAYAKGWRAQALEGSSQRKYEVLPADYCLRAIPLEPGHHRLKLQYLPTGFVVGKWVSVVTGLAFLGLVGAWGKGKFRWVKGRSLKTEG